MQTIHFGDCIPSVFAEFTVDNFGNEILTVSNFDHDLRYFQIRINEGTWWHLFRLGQKIREWRDGGRDE